MNKKHIIEKLCNMDQQIILYEMFHQIYPKTKITLEIISSLQLSNHSQNSFCIQTNLEFKKMIEELEAAK